MCEFETFNSKGRPLISDYLRSFHYPNTSSSKISTRRGFRPLSTPSVSPCFETISCSNPFGGPGRHCYWGLDMSRPWEPCATVDWTNNWTVRPQRAGKGCLREISKTAKSKLEPFFWEVGWKQTSRLLFCTLFHLFSDFNADFRLFLKAYES